MEHIEEETLETAITPEGFRVYSLKSTAVTPAHDIYDYTEGRAPQQYHHVIARYSNAVGTVIIHANGVYGDGPISRDDTVIVRDCQHEMD